MIKIYGGTSTKQLMHLNLEKLKYSSNCFLIALKRIQISPKTIQLISIIINKYFIRRKFICAGSQDSSKNNGSEEPSPPKKLKENTCFRDSLDYQSIGLVLILSGLKKNSVQDNPSFTKGLFKEILKVKLNQNILHFLLLLEMKKKHAKLNTVLKIHWWNITKMLQPVLASVVQYLHSPQQKKIILQGLL